MNEYQYYFINKLAKALTITAKTLSYMTNTFPEFEELQDEQELEDLISQYLFGDSHSEVTEKYQEKIDEIWEETGGYYSFHSQEDLRWVHRYFQDEWWGNVWSAKNDLDKFVDWLYRRKEMFLDQHSPVELHIIGEKYYLYYRIGDYGFHRPIRKSEKQKYQHLPENEITDFTPYNVGDNVRIVERAERLINRILRKNGIEPKTVSEKREEALEYEEQQFLDRQERREAFAFDIEEYF